MKRDWTWLVVAILAVSNVILVALILIRARATGPGDGARGPEFLIQELELTRSQRQEFEKLVADHRAAMERLTEKMQAAKLDFFVLLREGGVQDSLVQQKAESIGRLQSEIDMEVYRHLESVRRICDEEQRSKLDGLINQGIRMTGPRPPR